MTCITDMCGDFKGQRSRSSDRAVGGCSSHHLQEAGAILCMAAALQAAELVNILLAR